MESGHSNTGLEKGIILVVDDDPTFRHIIHNTLQQLGYFAVKADNGAEAMRQIASSPPDLILTDILMPEISGYDLLKSLKSNEKYRSIPVIIISGVENMDSVISCIKMGAEDYLLKSPFNTELLDARIKVCLERKKLTDEQEAYRHEIELLNSELQSRISKEISKATAAQLGMLFALSKLAESRDPETGGHLERIQEYCKVLCGFLRVNPRYRSLIDRAFVDNIHPASCLHDIGKVGVPDSVLLKPGKLTAEEFEMMKKHTVVGFQTLLEVHRKFPNSPLVYMAMEIALSHHEKWDGSGYPDQLSGNSIPLSARIVAVADVYDALSSKRCYKDAMPHEKAKGIICDGGGKHFDPDMVDAFIKAEKEFQRVSRTYVE
ncbi:MAG: response regulator [Candidatus Riflebacteria bacterium]|nr:response regulator [Candidatus Riflebacteria bacterium]